MRAQTSTVSDEEHIREGIRSWTQALHDKDVDRLMAHYTPDILAFDLAPPLQHAAADYRRGFAEWFRTWSSPIRCEVRDLQVTVGGDVAFAHSLNHLSGDRISGERSDIWVRATICFEKVNGRWLAAHEHISVPFYMDGSVRAAVDLKP
jgi:PhnB protein